ncbi:MAG: flagellar hook-basal body complex protein [Phycisphaerae bacterium]|nr:flagellar hook-basal body complex protein [Phycisphaerae bacterium]
MASTVAMFTALSGMNANARNLDVLGNNIANVNTTGYKSTRLLFSSMYAQTFSTGTAPGETSGGKNPGQIGLGVTIAGTQRKFTGGTISPTGNPRDMAIEGDGFFVVNHNDEQLYTRDGSFATNSESDLVTSAGDRVMGFGIDENFNVNESELTSIKVPVGTMKIAEASTRVRLSGNLNAAGAVPSQGSSTSLLGDATNNLRAISTANPPVASGNRLQTDTRLVDLEDPALPASDTPLFTSGQFFEIRQAEKGSKQLPAERLEITDTTSLQDLFDFIERTLGISTDSGDNPDGKAPGVTLDPVTGAITIVGNIGKTNDLSIEPTDFRLLDAAGAYIKTPFYTDKTADADGESVRTTFFVYDSLGNTVNIDVTFVLESRGNNGTTWRYFAESADDSDDSLLLGTGSVEFDTRGQLATTEPISLSIDRSDSGADTPLAISVRLRDGQDNVTALADTTSAVAATSRDGVPIGTLTSFGVGGDGTITGSFSNGMTRTLGRVALANFTNDGGLVDAGPNLFRVGPNSGSPVVTSPGNLGAGRIAGGSLELSNVDIAEEFINLIVAQTGYSAASRVIQTTNDLFQQLLVLAR